MKLIPLTFTRSGILLLAVMTLAGCASKPLASYKSRPASDPLKPADVRQASSRDYPWYEKVALLAIEIRAAFTGSPTGPLVTLDGAVPPSPVTH